MRIAAQQPEIRNEKNRVGRHQLAHRRMVRQREHPPEKPRCKIRSCECIWTHTKSAESSNLVEMDLLAQNRGEPRHKSSRFREHPASLWPATSAWTSRRAKLRNRRLTDACIMHGQLARTRNEMNISAVASELARFVRGQVAIERPSGRTSTIM